MKILLTTRFAEHEVRNPIAILDLAPYLRQFGHEVDCAYLHRLPEKQYDLVGLSVLESLDNQPVADSIMLRDRYHTETLVGGKWTRTLDEKQILTLSRAGVGIVQGPGEILFSDEIDFPHYPSWDRQDFIALGNVRYEVMSSRGCPYHCNFCHNTEQKISYFSTDRLADNVSLLFSFGIKSVFITDDIFTIKVSRMREVREMLNKRGTPIDGRCIFFTHVNFTNERTVAEIKAFSPDNVQIGIESGDDRMLGLMNKRFTAAQAEDAIKMLSGSGITVHGLFLIGYPGETHESLENTYQFVRRMKPYLKATWVSYYQPVPKTVGYMQAFERTGNVEAQKTNTDISYVDPDVSADLLRSYREKIMVVPIQ